MQLSDRTNLIYRFRNGNYLSADDYASLINSMLNKFEDKFHGRWRRGRTYCKGDVVFYSEEELINTTINHKTGKLDNTNSEKQPEKVNDPKTVIARCNFWMMWTEPCICGEKSPPESPEHWMPFPDDGDWVALPEKGMMWAKVFDRVGIGVGPEAGDRTDERNYPQARLDVRKLSYPAALKSDAPKSDAPKSDAPKSDAPKPESGSSSTSNSPPPVAQKGDGRWILFPSEAAQTQMTLLHYEGQIVEIPRDVGTIPTIPGRSPAPPPVYTAQRVSYFTSGLSWNEVTWCSDADRGFVFRRGPRQTKEITAFHLDPTSGTVMLVVQPRKFSDKSPEELATLGLNVATPAALLDITDPHRGYLYFLPHSATDPTLRLLRPKTEETQIFTSLSVGQQETVLESNTTQGFGFYQRIGSAGEAPLSPDLLLKLRQSSQTRPQVGIGTATPVARLDIHDPAETVQVQCLPEQGDGNALPAIALIQHPKDQEPKDQEPTVLTTALGDRFCGWITNAKQGFVFQTPSSPVPPQTEQSPPRQLTGQTHLAIHSSGYVGLGTETPSTRLEITSDGGFGSFLFNPDKPVHSDRQTSPAMVIRHREPEQNFTLGTSPTHAVLATDTPEGFQFKAPSPSDPSAGEPTADPLDIASGRVLVTLSPEANGRVGVGRAPRDYEVDVHGIVQAIALYQDTDPDQMQNVKPLTQVLTDVLGLRPVTFEWQQDGEPTPNPAGSPNPDCNPANNPQIGLLAHEVEKIFPQVVRTASDGTQSVAYTSLVPVLIQAIADLDEQHRLDLRRIEDLATLQANRLVVLAVLLVISWAIALLLYLF